MENLLDILLNQYQTLILLIVRVTGLFIISPIFSRINIPETYKIGFSVLLSFILLNTVEGPSTPLTDLLLIIACIKELITGFIIGFIAYLFFSVFFIIGQIIDIQIGFGMVSVLDPQSNVQIPITGNFYQIIATLIFLVVNGHHLLIEALVSSYDYIPMGKFVFSSDMVRQIVFILGKLFILGFKISSPILVVIILADVLLGILAKTMPQMNVFIVGMPLKIMVGIFLIIVTLPGFFIALQHIFNNMHEEIFNFLKAIQKG
ncbi:flagellar biosynthetic protein FliR [Gottschalkia acidurici]|nr:flagellar biosynthetic protein FliR [Gottschalkia acidurici]